jgi:hypothetical protein
VIVDNGERISDISEGLQAEIRRAWQNLENARQTLEQASDLTAQYRRLLRSGGVREADDARRLSAPDDA